MSTNIEQPAGEKKSLNFIEQIVEEDIRNGKNGGEVVTRFPPEPNGYLHIGHAKSICLNFGLAKKYNGRTNLRFDDTNPEKEDTEYVNSIMEDIRWLGFQWHGEPLYASDYFEQLYQWSEQMILAGKAYVDDQSAEDISKQRGTVNSSGTESPFRNRPVDESLDLFRRMRAGEFAAGTKILRAKIDMASPNMLLRDPIMYRIIHAEHHRTGDKWCIYPMYDWAHGESDYLEGITHSICTLEFDIHRPLYEWFLEQVYEKGRKKPQQIEFARLNINYTVMSKRKLLELVKNNHVKGWDDPRMLTITGMRRRGFTPASIRKFAETVGVAKRDNIIDYGLLEFCVREDLNKIAPRIMAVTDPIKIVLTNYPAGKVEYLATENNPEDATAGTREMAFSGELFIERGDFMENPPKKYFRLSPGTEVRLKSAYIIKAEEVVKNSNGDIIEVRCTYDSDSRSGSGTEASERKVKATIHWVSANHAVDAEVRLYDRLFTDSAPDSHEGKDFKEFLNPDSLRIVKNCKIELSCKDLKPETHVQFQRLGYFVTDRYDSKPGSLVFNRIVSLKDEWTKLNQQ
jgi:glutaminyl-tRNA synthetase